MKYVVEDVIRYARAYGLHLRPGAYVDLSAACRGFLLARESGVARAYNQGVHLARWHEGLDISQPDVLCQIAAGCGLEQRAFGEALKGGRFIEKMKCEQADAIAAGVFGVPFFEFEGQRFWGNDRLEWLLEAATRTRLKVEINTQSHQGRQARNTSAGCAALSAALSVLSAEGSRLQHLWAGACHKPARPPFTCNSPGRTHARPS